MKDYITPYCAGRVRSVFAEDGLSLAQSALIDENEDDERPRNYRLIKCMAQNAMKHRPSALGVGLAESARFAVNAGRC